MFSPPDEEDPPFFSDEQREPTPEERAASEAADRAALADPDPMLRSLVEKGLVTHADGRVVRLDELGPTVDRDHAPPAADAATWRAAYLAEAARHRETIVRVQNACSAANANEHATVDDLIMLIARAVEQRGP